jgi:hypothetical protein
MNPFAELMALTRKGIKRAHDELDDEIHRLVSEMHAEAERLAGLNQPAAAPEEKAPDAPPAP